MSHLCRFLLQQGTNVPRPAVHRVVSDRGPCREGCESVAEFLALADRMVLADSAFNFQSFTGLLIYVIKNSMCEISTNSMLHLPLPSYAACSSRSPATVQQYALFSRHCVDMIALAGKAAADTKCCRARFNVQRATWALQLIMFCLADVWDHEISLVYNSNQHSQKHAAPAQPPSQRLPFPEVLQWLKSAASAANHEQWNWVVPSVERLRNACSFLEDSGLAVTACQARMLSGECPEVLRPA